MFLCHLNLSWIIIKLSTDISMHESEVDANDADDDDPDYQPSFDITAILCAFVFLHYLEQMKLIHQICVWNTLFWRAKILISIILMHTHWSIRTMYGFKNFWNIKL